MSGGKLSGCQLVYNAIAQDFTYGQGTFMRIAGNVVIVKIKDAFGSNLKVVVLDIDPTNLSTSPSPPSSAYTVDDEYQTKLASMVSRAPSDTPGALFSIFHLWPTMEMVVMHVRRAN